MITSVSEILSPASFSSIPVTDQILGWTADVANTTAYFLSPALLSSSFHIPKNITSAAGNTYKNVYEATSMHSGLILILFVNIITAVVGILFYRYVILRETGTLSQDEIRLLRKYPKIRSPNSYTPFDSLIRGPPPMRWNGWYNFFTTSESALSRDAQVYLLFQRVCIFTTVVCAIISTVFLLPSYWLGGAFFNSSNDSSPSSTLLSILKSDRGIFERFTSHNLPVNSPLIMLQLPVFLVLAICITIIYSIVTTAAGEAQTLDEWLYSNPASSSSSIFPAPPTYRPAPLPGDATYVPSPNPCRHWTVFARGLPFDINSADHLYSMLDTLFPSQIAGVELVCKGKVSEARLLRSLSSAKHRLEYLYETADDIHLPRDSLPHQTFVGRIFALFARRRSRTNMIHELEQKIESLEKDFESRKSEPVHDFLGCAFISFTSPHAAASALKDFPCHLRKISLGQEDVSIQGGASTVNLAMRLHRRSSMNESIPGPLNFGGLCRGTANLLPESLRNRMFPSSSFQSLLPIHDNLAREHSHDLEMHRRARALLQLRCMKAERAPKSGDIIWRNIGISFFERTIREMVVQILVFTFLILFTSPVTMLTALKLVFSELSVLTDPQVIFGGSGPNHNSTSGSTNHTGAGSFFGNIGADGSDTVESLSEGLIDVLPSFLTSNTFLTTAVLAYLPVLILALVFSMVPSLLRLTCTLEGYPTRSALQMSVFRKTSFYYVMNSVVLPSLALNTASEFLQMVYKQSSGGTNVKNALPILQRLFSGDIAYFLCCYLVQLALTGSIFFLLRIPSNISMMVRRRMALTPLEAAEAKCAEIFDFPRHYAYNVTVMSMVLLFGFMAPLIWYFGLFYFLCKHGVDCYALRYVHPRTHIDGRLPRLSSNFVLIWTIVSQLSHAVIFYLQGWVRAAIVTALLCFFTLAGCLSISFTMGNHILQAVSYLRDWAITWVLHAVGSQYSWGDGTAIIDMSSGSSTQSFNEAQETNSLLQQGSLQRCVSKSLDRDRMSQSVENDDRIPGSSGFEASLYKKRGELPASPVDGTPERSDDGTSGSPAGVENTPPDTEPDIRGYDSDDEGGDFTMAEDIQSGCASPSTRYGSCNAVGQGD